jgi:rhodanese-related sulfurtransferase
MKGVGMIASYRHAALALAACLLSTALAANIAHVGVEQETQALPPTGAVGPAQGQRLIKDLGKGLVVLDVRSPSEFDQGHVLGALNVPVADIESRMAEIPADRSTLIVCRAGGRAARAYKTLAQARPGMAEKGLWYLDAVAEYRDGTYAFKDR